MPFYKKLEGQPSNSLHIQTLEDVPSAPPTNIRAEMINKTSASLSWAPPPPQHRNGILKGKDAIQMLGLDLWLDYTIWHTKGETFAGYYNLEIKNLRE